MTANLSTAYGANQGDTVQIGLSLNSQLALGGVDFTIEYDSTELRLLNVTQGPGLNNWELFTVSEDDSLSIVQVLAIADIQNGPGHPNPQDFYPHDVAAYYSFEVLTPITQTPVSFFWIRCGDNAASNREGDSLMVLSRLYDPDQQLLWDETDNQNFPDSMRPANIGLPDTCVQRASTIYYLIDMFDGLVTSDYLCGDANGDGAANITDAVHIVQFIFAGGPPPDPYAAGDCNCDGFPNITDVVCLVQYIFAGGPAPCADCP